MLERNIIANIHPVVNDYRGENYWFNGCAAYVMESVAPRPGGDGKAPATDYDYSLFAGVTGDNFTQVWPKDGRFRGECASDYLYSAEYAAGVFGWIGYAREVVTDRREYAAKVVESIDRGVPVICLRGFDNLWSVVVGYEDGGQTTLHMVHDRAEPERVSAGADIASMIFVGGKVREVPLARVYREAIERLPGLLATQTDGYVFGAEAFRQWADWLDSGGAGVMTDEGMWFTHCSYVCILATNGTCCHSFLNKAMELNPDMGFLKEVGALYRKTARMWGGEGKDNDADSLEALGGGVYAKAEPLNDPVRRSRVAAKIRAFAVVIDEAARILSDNL
ncbi:MAG: hypothetical protein LBS11_12570 [Oscillospiraceae bacterium]|nr:hypothetical protein [Oscillospiraceae bacterium]